MPNGSNSFRSGKGVVALDLGRSVVGEMAVDEVPQSEGISISWKLDETGSSCGAGSELMLSGIEMDGAVEEERRRCELTAWPSDCVRRETRLTRPFLAVATSSTFRVCMYFQVGTRRQGGQYQLGETDRS